MSRYAFFVLAAAMSLSGTFASAQAPASQSEKAPPTTIKLLVVLSRYEGEKKISSFPYNLSLVPGRSGSIRTGAELAVPTTVTSLSANDKAGADKTATMSYTMQQVGTQVNATVTPTSDGKYGLALTVTDRYIGTGAQTPQGRVPNVPTFKNMTSASEAILSNGETIQFTSSSDQSSNETFKIDVTLTVGNK